MTGKLRALPILLQRAYEEIRLFPVLRPQQDVYQVLTAGLALDYADFVDGAGLAHGFVYHKLTTLIANAF